MKLTTNNQKLLDECIRIELEENENYTNVNDFFEFFASSMVLKDCDLSDDEIDNGLTGHGNDGGIDGFFLFVNGELVTDDLVESINIPRGCTIELVLIQSKYVSSFGEDAILKWKTTSSNLLEMKPLGQYRKRYTEKIIENFTLFGNIIKKSIRLQCKLQISYHYATLGLYGSIHPNVIAQKNELIKIVNGIYPSASVSVDFWDADTIMETYNRTPNTSVNLTFADQPISLGASDMVALVNLGTYYKFITDDAGNLNKRFFEANVRDYQGSNSVNKSIAESLYAPGNEDFWWLNNGVTILASGLTRVTSKEVIIENPEIVNGLQTSREIYNYFASNQNGINGESRNVLVRIVKPADENSRDKIIFATNNQTNIPQYSLRVTDAIHVQIELYFKSKGLYYDRRKNYYKNLRKKSTDIIGVSFLAQCLISLILKKPDYARARPSTLLVDESIYNQLYSGEQDLEVYYKAAMIGKKVKSILNTSQLPRPAKNDILFYVIYAVLVKLLHKSDFTFSDLLSFNLDLLDDDAINDAIHIVNSKYEEKGASGSVAKSPTFIDDVNEALNM